MLYTFILLLRWYVFYMQIRLRPICWYNRQLLFVFIPVHCINCVFVYVHSLSLLCILVYFTFHPFVVLDLFKCWMILIPLYIMTKSRHLLILKVMASSTRYGVTVYHLTLSFFCTFWHISHYWLNMKDIFQNAMCHIFAGDTFFTFLYINVILCLSLSRHWLGLYFAGELLEPSWCCALFSLTLFVHIYFVAPAWEGHATFHMVCKLWLLPILSENWYPYPY